MIRSSHRLWHISFISSSRTRSNFASHHSTSESHRHFSSLPSMASSENYSVNHDKNRCEFFFKLTDEGTDKAFLTYSWLGPGHMDMNHTEVPPSFRGKGVAKVLAKAAFAYAVKEDAKMTLSCTYLQKYLKDNPLPEYLQRVV